jgi:hypothetical protein
MRRFLRVLVSIVVPTDERNVRLRCLAVSLTVVISAGVGHWVCTPDPLRPDQWNMTWWACGMLGVTSAAAVAGWVGGRVPILIPLLLPVLITAFTLGFMDLADRMGHKLDAKYGFDVIALAVFGGFVGFLVMLPVMALHARLMFRRERRCPDRESYRDVAG